MINYLALLSALGVSAVSAYYSIIGLTAIFSSQFWPVVIMGSVLEVGKLVTASWLYRNWKISPFWIKSYLTLAVALLMLITSMGIFGFLSKAHIEQTLAINTGAKDQISIVQSKIDFDKQAVNDIDIQIAQIDNAITKMNDRGQASSSLRAATQQRKNRDALVKRKEDLVKNISEQTTIRIKLESDIKKLEAEVGPIKYIADMVYESSDVNQLEKAVRLVIIILVLVFDPLAVILLIAANHGITTRKQLTSDTNVFTINSDKIFNISEKR